VNSDDDDDDDRKLLCRLTLMMRGFHV
jgi:hypothetical protein